MSATCLNLLRPGPANGCALYHRRVSLGGRLVAAHTQKQERPLSWPSKKPSNKARGLGHEHAKERARLLPAAYGKMCPYHQVDPKCPGRMMFGQELHLDHGKPRALGGVTGDGTGRISHGPCNQRAGARLAVALRRNKGQLPGCSRIW